MATRGNNLKNNLTKLTTIVMIGILISLGVKANAQCSAQFLSYDSLDYGNFINQSSVSGFNFSGHCTWSFGDGTTSTSYDNANAIHQYGAVGNYYVCLTIVDSLNSCSSTFCDSISITQPGNTTCNANFTSIVDSSTVNFNDLSSSQGAMLYLWSFGDGSSSSTSGNTSHTYSTNGTFTVCLTISDSTNNCSDAYCQEVYVFNSSNIGCAALFTPFDSADYGYFWNHSSAVNGFISTWDFGDGSTGTSTLDITHQYAAPGTYTACLTILDAATSCTDTYCTTITIGQGGGASCNAYFLASTAGSVASFTDLSSGNPMNYLWDFGDGASSTTNGSVSHTYALDGTYAACLTINDTTIGCSDTYCRSVTIGNPPGIGCNALFNLVQDSTNSYIYTAYSYASTGIGYYHFWDFGDGTISNSQLPTHVYAGIGPYMVCLTVTDSSGCTNTFCDSLYAGRSSSGIITLYVVQASTTSVSEIELIGALENYPNPFNSSTTISYTLMENSTIELSVVDLLGKTVAVLENTSKQAGNHKIEFNADGVSEGMYLLQLKAGNSISTKKLIINK